MGLGGLAQKLVDSACLAPKTDGKWKPLHFFDKVHVTYFVKSLEVLLSIPYFPNNIPDSEDVFNRTGNLLISVGACGCLCLITCLAAMCTLHIFFPLLYIITTCAL